MYNVLDDVTNVVETLRHVHATRIVHRDLRTSNILMGPRRFPLIIDWGFACSVPVAINEELRVPFRGAKGFLSSATRAAVENGTYRPDAAHDLQILLRSCFIDGHLDAEPEKCEEHQDWAAWRTADEHARLRHYDEFILALWALIKKPDQ